MLWWSCEAFLRVTQRSSCVQVVTARRFSSATCRRTVRARSRRSRNRFVASRGCSASSASFLYRSTESLRSWPCASLSGSSGSCRTPTTRGGALVGGVITRSSGRAPWALSSARSTLRTRRARLPSRCPRWRRLRSPPPELEMPTSSIARPSGLWSGCTTRIGRTFACAVQPFSCATSRTTQAPGPQEWDSTRNARCSKQLISVGTSLLLSCLCRDIPMSSWNWLRGRHSMLPWGGATNQVPIHLIPWRRRQLLRSRAQRH
mmetsp:Transcript_44152/g.116876  ORF Transcript_44152/g.116876 Transcript_44152/m.116876 type:complete len:261 (+) Transcript_44152:113-895(+)